MSNKEGIFSTAHVIALVAEGERLASEELCFLLTSRWQHGPAVGDQLGSWAPLKAQGLRTVFGAFSALGMINGAAPLTAP